MLNLVVGTSCVIALVGLQLKMFWRYARCWLAGQVW